MVSAVTSASAALRILQKAVPPQAASALQEQDPLRPLLDPRSAYRLPAQSLDALLQVRAQLRRDQVHEPQAQGGLTPLSSEGAAAPSSMLGATVWKDGEHWISDLEIWQKDIARLKAHSAYSEDSSLMPWNSPDVIQQLKDTDVHMKNQEASERQLVTSDAAVFASMGQTPPADVARIKAMGGEVWYERTQTYDRISDKEFFRNIKNYQLYGLTLRDPIDPTDKVSQAFLKGTAQIIRASNVPEAQYNSASYNMYAFNAEAKEYKWIGGWGRTDYNETYIKDLEKKNPTMNVTGIGAFNDFAFILYPKTASATPTSTAVAQSSVTATGTKPTAATTR